MNTAAAEQTIRIRGARTHNLQNIDVDIPTGRLIVITGVSGSGKSSLAFDTLFAEGQRRYLESVSVHTRHLLQQLRRPNVDEVSGLPPTVCVDQRVGAVPARSTLAVTSEIHDFLRLLYARAGKAHCTQCGQPVSCQTPDQIVRQTLDLPERSRLMILSPVVRDRRGSHRDVIEEIARKGFVRARIDGELVDVADVSRLSPSRSHTIEAVIDRVILKAGIEQRLRESIDLACRESEGMCVISRQVDEDWVDALFSTRFACAACQLSFPTPEPRSFSFNSPWGACPTCQGFGVTGTAELEADVTVLRRKPCPVCNGSRLQPFPAAVTFAGMQLSEFSRASVTEALTIVRNWLAEVTGAMDPAVSTSEFSTESRLVARKTLPEILQRLQCLQSTGLHYLSLDRPTRSLSGGEFQRARLAACLGSQLYGACFVLDEPTTGLHPRDTRQLLSTLQQLRDSGATVVVVEHDGEIMQAADWLIDLGPGAGRNGGRQLYSGPASAAADAISPTGDYLSGRLKFGDGDPELSPDANRSDVTVPVKVVVAGARANNLQNITVEIPLGKLVAVTGISGSGKSTLIMETLLPVAQTFLSVKTANRTEAVRLACADAECDAIRGLEYVDRIVAVDNRLPGRQARSCIATISGIWNDVRRLFAKTREARLRGYTARRFSFTSDEGRCLTCRGTGVRNLKMSFLPDAEVQCVDCQGRRFNRATLNVRFADRSVADVLAMSVEEACRFFADFAQIHSVLQIYLNVGLGYLTLGQSAATFSGGEAQRVRLAAELAGKTGQRTLYILDEPTTGLHPADVVQLHRVLQGLVQQGNSVVVIEHHVELIRNSHWVIDLGPEGGPDGGQIVCCGSPETIAQHDRSATAAALRVRLPIAR
ncbi:MAG: hypothetical protein KDA85_14190 [Planctomycetaceae bacterium]|nr:hypothetical protein [Planctomycetaceae bacterium]